MRFNGNLETSRFARRQCDNAAFRFFERFPIGIIRGRFQTGHVAINGGVSVLPNRKARQLFFVELDAYTPVARGRL